MTPSSRSPFSLATRSVQTCFCSRGKLFGQPCDHCSLMFPTWDDHSTCLKCRFSAGLCSVDLHNPCEICQSWSLTTWRRLRKLLRDARQKSTKRGTEHWSCQAPVLLAWMDWASTSSELHPDMGSIADSDIREVDLELAAATPLPLCAQLMRHLWASHPIRYLCIVLVHQHLCLLRGLASRQSCKGQSACFQVLPYPYRGRQECLQCSTALTEHHPTASAVQRHIQYSLCQLSLQGPSSLAYVLA